MQSLRPIFDQIKQNLLTAYYEYYDSTSPLWSPTNNGGDHLGVWQLNTKLIICLIYIPVCEKQVIALGENSFRQAIFDRLSTIRRT
jgi:hypothetical protein